jgi:hypothetical protein
MVGVHGLNTKALKIHLELGSYENKIFRTSHFLFSFVGFWIKESKI